MSTNLSEDKIDFAFETGVTLKSATGAGTFMITFIFEKRITKSIPSTQISEIHKLFLCWAVGLFFFFCFLCSIFFTKGGSCSRIVPYIHIIIIITITNVLIILFSQLFLVSSIFDTSRMSTTIVILE